MTFLTALVLPRPIYPLPGLRSQIPPYRPLQFVNSHLPLSPSPKAACNRLSFCNRLSCVIPLILCTGLRGLGGIYCCHYQLPWLCKGDGRRQGPGEEALSHTQGHRKTLGGRWEPGGGHTAHRLSVSPSSRPTRATRHGHSKPASVSEEAGNGIGIH